MAVAACVHDRDLIAQRLQRLPGDQLTDVRIVLNNEDAFAGGRHGVDRGMDVRLASGSKSMSILSQTRNAARSRFGYNCANNAPDRLQVTRIAAVIPAYRVEGQIQGVLRELPPYLKHVIVVDDASDRRHRGAGAGGRQTRPSRDPAAAREEPGRRRGHDHRFPQGARTGRRDRRQDRWRRADGHRPICRRC